MEGWGGGGLEGVAVIQAAVKWCAHAANKQRARTVSGRLLWSSYGTHVP